MVQYALGPDTPVAALAEPLGQGILPDDRGYELVTPPLKGDSSLLIDAQPFVDGRHVSYNAFLPLPGSAYGGFQNLLATRSPSAWQNVQLNPPQGDDAVPNYRALDNGGNTNRQVVFTSDVSSAFLSTWAGVDPADQDQSTSDVYKRMVDGSFQMVSRAEEGPETDARPRILAGISADGAHALFQTLENVPNSTVDPGQMAVHTAGELPYERIGGHTKLVGVLPDGTVPACGAVVGRGPMTYGAGANGATLIGAVSEDASRVVFTTPDPNAYLNPAPNASCNDQAQIYVRRQGITTVQASAPAPGAPTDVTGSAVYLGASADTRRVFFVSPQQLTPDAPFVPNNFPPKPRELYMYDVDTGQLTRVSRGASGTAAGNLGEDDGIVALSADGSHVFFTSHGELAPDAVAGERNLYVFANGQTTLISGAGTALASEIRPGSRVLPNAAQSTPDGSKLLFLNSANLTSYDSGGHVEAYVYDVTDQSLTCVSCNPTGAPAQGDAQFVDADYSSFNQFLPPVSLMSADGERVFFESSDDLVPQDTNGLIDVYQWHDGTISLLSSGTNPNGGGDRNGSHVIGIADDGNDVFFLTADRLVPQDRDTAFDIYDARVGGGFPLPPAPVDCLIDCQGSATAPPPFAFPSTSRVTGTGNVQPGPRASFSVPRLSARSRTQLAHGRRVTLVVRVGRGGRLKAVATAKVGPGRWTVARAAKSLRRRGTTRLGLRLSPAARRYLSRHRTLTIRLSVSFGGTRKDQTMRLTR
jgi:Tol biopolymer transport system component